MNRTFTKYILVLNLWLFALVNAIGQVTTEPAFPRADQSVKIIYDASQGTTGLAGVNQVYIHIGAVVAGPTSNVWEIVPFAWGQDVEQAKMTRVEGDIWEYELVPNELFNPTTSQTIYRMGMVFRNAAGTLEGKSATNGDFFVNLSQGFEVQFLQPVLSSLLLDIGETLEIKINSSASANLSILVNDTPVATQANVSELSYVFQANAPGTYEIKALGVAGDDQSERIIRISVVEPSQQAPLPAGVKKGINYISDTEVIFVLEAPGKKNVFLIGDFNDWEIDPTYQMNITPDREMFWYHLTDLVPQQEYIFQYLVDGSIRIGDPYADKTSDPFHDQEIIDQNRYPGLLPYPHGQTEFQATYLQTAQEPYVWQHTEYTKPKPEELVIYELLVRDFDERRTYKAVTERLDYLQELGINAIELLPIKNFEGNLSWGYNPSFFFAVDKFYGTKNDLKELIDEAHKRNMVVLLDMVLNHAFGQSPFVRLYNDGDYGAPTPDNPWLNRTARHPFNVGYDFNHESAYTKAFVDSVNNYWLTEYKFDGYRFDLSKGFTQRDSGDDVGLWSQRDESRINIWKNIYDNIKATHPDAYVILEHFADNAEETELANYGMMLWGNLNYQFRDMAKGLNRNFNNAYYANRNWEKNHLVAYMESHDEERLMWETLTHGATSPINLRQLSNAVDRNQLLAAFYFGVPGPKMIWQFGEFGYDEELNNDRLGIKPTRWEYLEDPERVRLFNLYRAMISLKNNHKVMNSPETVVLNLNSNVKSIILREADMDLVMLGNFGLNTAANVSFNFPYPGRWYDYLTGEEISVGGNIFRFDLPPNRFHIYTSKKLPLPEGEILEIDPILNIPNREINSGMKLYPIPASQRLNVDLPSDFSGGQFRIMDLTGRILNSGTASGGPLLEVELTGLKPGVYIFELTDNRGIRRTRFLKE